MNNIKVAAVSCYCPAGQVRKNLDTTAAWVGEAREAGVDIVCFPELNISGYCLDVDLNAEAAGSYDAIVAELSALAVKTSIGIIAGTVKKDAGTADRFSPIQLFCSPDGHVGAYQKTHIAPPEQTVFSAGFDVPLFAIEQTQFGIQLCYDAHFPELTTRMALLGADILFIPHASPRGGTKDKQRSWMRHLPARAFDNGLFVVACNQCGDNGGGLTFPALAMVIGPSGKGLAEHLKPDGMVVADLSADDLDAVRNHRMRYFLPNRRPDIY
jgi:predicted amidohydrolase